MGKMGMVMGEKVSVIGRKVGEVNGGKWGMLMVGKKEAGYG